MKKIVSLFLCVLIFLSSFCFAEGNLIEDTARIVLSGGASFGAVGGLREAARPCRTDILTSIIKRSKNM